MVFIAYHHFGLMGFDKAAEFLDFYTQNSAVNFNNGEYNILQALDDRNPDTCTVPREQQNY